MDINKSGIKFTDRCRICLNVEEEMAPLFEHIFEAKEENQTVVISLADILRSLSNIELEENETLKNVCNTCSMIIFNYNNLMQTFQETEAFLKNVLFIQKDVDDKSNNGSLEHIIIETYSEDSQTDDNNENSEDNIEQATLQENPMSEDNIGYKEDTPTETEVKTKKYACAECGDVFLLRSGFNHHMIQKHNRIVKRTDLDQFSEDIKIKLPTNDSKITLKFVQTTLPRIKHRFQCQICRETFNSTAELKKHYDVHRTWKCKLCDSTFIRKSYLSDHMITHTADRNYVCDVCDKTFKYRNGLYVHKMSHASHRQHVCDSCGQGFNAKSTLSTHIKLKHKTEKMFPCPECQCSFKMKSWLDKHFMRRHTKNRTKDFVCSECGIAYLNKYTLTRHINDKHLGKGKRLTCHICQKTYSFKNKLAYHMRKKHNIVDGEIKVEVN